MLTLLLTPVMLCVRRLLGPDQHRTVRNETIGGTPNVQT